MKFTVVLQEGLKRDLEVVFPKDKLKLLLDNKVNESKSTMQIKGFRPGKVPESFIRKTYAKGFMAEIVNDSINTAIGKIAQETGETPISQPELILQEDENYVNGLLSGNEDLKFNVKYEVKPQFELKDLSSYKVDRQIVDVPQDEIDNHINSILSSTREFVQKDSAAELNDRVTIDYVGKIDDAPFPNGADKNALLVLGSKTFIPGFEEQLVGVKAGDKKIINVKFPEEYGASDLAGKDASFDIEVKKVESAPLVELNDENAKKIGIESAEKLKSLVTSQIESRYGSVTRQKVKRQILDLLAKDYDFDLPESLVNAEYASIIEQMKQEDPNFEIEEGSKDEEEYKQLAKRRVLLGLVINKIGEEAKIQVSNDEIQQAIFRQLQYFPGREKEMLKFFQNNAQAVASIRAPLFEDKVIDHIMSQISINDKKVSAEELLNDDFDDETKNPAKETNSKKEKVSTSKKPAGSKKSASSRKSSKAAKEE